MEAQLTNRDSYLAWLPGAIELANAAVAKIGRRIEVVLNDGAKPSEIEDLQRIRTRGVPTDYLAFVREINGASFEVGGEQWFNGIKVYSIREVIKVTSTIGDIDEDLMPFAHDINGVFAMSVSDNRVFDYDDEGIATPIASSLESWLRDSFESVIQLKTPFRYWVPDMPIVYHPATGRSSSDK